MAVRAIVVEDEPLARQTLRDFIAEVHWIELVAEAADGFSAVEMTNRLRPDLIFLDVQMPELSGLQVLERISCEPEIVFTTAYDRYAVSAFGLEALDNLLKPFGRERFQRAMNRVRARFQFADDSQTIAAAHPSMRERAADLKRKESGEPLRRLFVRDARGRVVQLRAEDISHLVADGDYVAVYALGKSYLVNLTLNDFEQRLDFAFFRRVHRSAIINLDHVISFDPHDRRLLLKLRGGSEVLASRAGSQALRELIA